MTVLFLILIVLILALFFKNKRESSTFNSSRVDFLRRIIEELSSKNPNKKLSEQLKDYRNELNDLQEKDNPSVLFSNDTAPVSTSNNSHDVNILKSDVESLWSNWYSTNSINLLLYIGAFLIVASASIFVGFQWETIGGELKAITITLLTLAFFASGLFFHRIPKIENAGATFTAIGALLIPFSGMAWYNFVLVNSSVTLGQVWLATSLVSLLTNLALVRYFKNPLYTYFASLGSLSLALSIVNIYQLGSDFYILGSIISAFVLLIAQIILGRDDKEKYRLYTQPLELTANILMPASLIIGGITAISQDKLLTGEATFSAILASAYYFACYACFKKPGYLLVSEIIFPISVILLFSWQKFPMVNLFYALSVLGIIDLFLARSFSKNKLPQESNYSLIVGLTKTIGAFVLSLITSQTPQHQIFISLIAISSGLICTWITQNFRFLLLSTSITTVTLYIFLSKILDLPNYIHILSLVYLTFGSAYYFVSAKYKDNPKISSNFLPSTVLYLTLSFILNVGSSAYLLVSETVITIILILASKQFDYKNLIYLAGIFFNLTVFTFLNHFKIPEDFYPLIYIGLAFLVYFASQILSEESRDRFVKISLCMALVTPIMFGFGSVFNKSALETNSLISAYAATALFAFESYKSRRSDLAYFTSGIGMFTYLWQTKILGVEETLFYTIPLGIYFLGLSYFRKLADDEQSKDLLNIIGILFLILPNLMLIYTKDNPFYWISLIGVGLALFAAGVSLKDKILTYGGITGIVLSILSQTFAFIFSLPKWLITGLGGLIFLVSAIFLMLRRKEDR